MTDQKTQPSETQRQASMRGEDKAHDTKAQDKTDAKAQDARARDAKAEKAKRGDSQLAHNESFRHANEREAKLAEIDDRHSRQAAEEKRKVLEEYGSDVGLGYHPPVNFGQPASGMATSGPYAGSSPSNTDDMGWDDDTR